MSAPTYPDFENRSGWNWLLPPPALPDRLETDTTADVAIIGAGYTGLAAARRWADERRDEQIVIVDSSEVGEGNPGRNSGFLLEISLANDADPAQMARLAQCNQLISATMNRLRDAVYDGGIDCAIERAGTYRAAAGDTGRLELSRYRAFLDAAGLPYDTLDRDQLESRIGTRFYAEGLYSPHCYLVQPAALIRGLAARLPANVSVYQHTPALSIDRTAKGWRVTTSRAVIDAEKVIVANNAFATRLGIAPSRIATIYTYAGLTDPLPQSALDQLGSEKSWGLLPAHRLGSTLRRTRDGRLLIRSCYDYASETANAAVTEHLGDRLHARFPQIDTPPFVSVWGGATGFTRGGAPVWGEVQPGLYVSAGCNGGGIVKGTLFGDALAELAMGLGPPDIPALFGEP